MASKAFQYVARSKTSSNLSGSATAGPRWPVCDEPFPSAPFFVTSFKCIDEDTAVSLFEHVIEDLTVKRAYKCVEPCAREGFLYSVGVPLDSSEEKRSLLAASLSSRGSSRRSITCRCSNSKPKKEEKKSCKRSDDRIRFRRGMV